MEVENNNRYVDWHQGLQSVFSFKIKGTNFESLDPLTIRYCKVNEVEKKRRQNLNYLALFYIRMNHLKSNGQRISTLKMLEEYIDENLDELFQDMGLREYFQEQIKVNKKEIEKSINAKSEYGMKQNFKD